MKRNSLLSLLVLALLLAGAVSSACNIGRVLPFLATSTPTPSRTPTPTNTRIPTDTPTKTTKPTDSITSVGGLAGSWQDPQTLTVHTIIWTGSAYEVVSCIDEDGEVFPITEQSWSEGVLSWTYYVPDTGYYVTFETYRLDGNDLITKWNGTAGSGSETLHRVSSTEVGDLTGTRWRVTYYDKAINQTMSYDLIFNSGGRLGSTNPYESTPDNDFWSQSGSTVTITFNNSYATYVGQISGTTMSGTATNIRDMEWTWEAYLLP